MGGIFDAALDAVIVMDGEGLVRDWNPVAEQVFGYSRSEALGERVEDLIIPGALRAAHRNGVARYLESGESTILDRRLEPPLILRTDGRVERPAIAGPLIGLTMAPKYRSSEVTLAPGDAVVLYTDSLTDARAPERILDEAEQAVSLISAEQPRPRHPPRHLS